MLSVFQPVALAAVSALSVWFWCHVGRAIRTGTANVHNVSVRRRERPAYYWLAVIVQTMFAAACTFGVARGLARWMSV
jgi:hypothetical protein